MASTHAERIRLFSCSCSHSQAKHVRKVNARPPAWACACRKRRALALHSRRDATQVGASGMCFDQSCQEAMDRLFVISIALPLVVAVLAFLFLYRNSSKQRRTTDVEHGSSDDEADNSPAQERAKDAIYRAMSYTTWPVEQSSPGEKLRIDVGPVGDATPRTFVFDRILSRPSEILAVTLPRPMGIVFEEESRTGRVVVGDIIDGSTAYQRSQVAKLDAGSRKKAVLVGDILRACTCTNFVYESSALFGARPPRRTIVLYGADDRRWPQVINALKRGDKADGPVTLVLERETQQL